MSVVEVAAELRVRSRAAQGLPAVVEDVAALRRVAGLARRPGELLEGASSVSSFPGSGDGTEHGLASGSIAAPAGSRSKLQGDCEVHADLSPQGGVVRLSVAVAPAAGPSTSKAL